MRDVLYGIHPVAECLRAGRRPVKKLWVMSADRLWDLARAAGAEPSVKPFFVTREAIARIAGTDAHQGVAAEVGEYPYVDFRDLLEEERPLVAALDNLTDPQNVGAILRSALCAGATGVTLRSHHAARITPAVAKASAGACEHLKAALVSNQAMFLRAAREAGCTVAALDPSGRSIWEAELDWSSGLVLVVGAEDRGISRLVGELCDVRLRIPMAGSFDSLNASAAASLALFEVFRRRLEARPPSGE